MVVQNNKSIMKNKRKEHPSGDDISKVKRVTIETSTGNDSTSDDSEVEQSASDNENHDGAETDGSEDAVISSGNEIDNSSKANSDSEPETANTMMKNEGWADSLAKILGTNKPKNKKTLVMSRAKKFAEVVKKEEPASFDVVGEEEDKKPPITDVKIETESIKKKKIEHPSVRVKPNILEKDRERILSKIATKGVVQLFNAVKNQQNSLTKEIDTAGLSEGKKEKILKKFDKRTFLDTLMGQTKSTIVDDSASQLKDEVKDEDKPKWAALRDDFMMGAKLKDWDKEKPDD